MHRTITVKGIGRVSAKPDTVVLSLSLDSRAKDYDKAMATAADNIEDITNAVVSVGFEKDAVKTTDFKVRTDYQSVKGHNGNYRQEFRGYVISHNLKAENARKKAEILCDASGVVLGKLLSIDYNWGEVDICSDTQYDYPEHCLASPITAKSIDIEPDDIEVSDTVTFAWKVD